MTWKLSESLLLQCSASPCGSASVRINVDQMCFIGKAIKITHRRRETEWDVSPSSLPTGDEKSFVKVTKKDISAQHLFSTAFPSS